jgi:hypothetical protein
MKPLSKVTLEVNNNDLADLYNIIGKVKSYTRQGSVERAAIESWQRSWSNVYEKHDNFYLVFDEGDIPVLFSLIQHIDPYWYITETTKPKKIMSEMLVKFLQDHSS